MGNSSSSDKKTKEKVAPANPTPVAAAAPVVNDYPHGKIDRDFATTLMAHVLRNLPTAQHNAWVCSSGSKGYCATKEMLQNGQPGHTLLIESEDLRDVGASSKGCCLLIYCFSVDRDFTNPYRVHIPSTVSHVTVYGNVMETPEFFLSGCTGLTALDLSPLSQVTMVKGFFLHECTGLSTLDLIPLSQVTEVQGSFLAGCTGLTALDLGPLSQLTTIRVAFLMGCTGLAALDLNPLSRVTEVQSTFLMGCTGLSTLDLKPLSQVTEVKAAFLAGCTGLTSLDLSPLSQVTSFDVYFLDGCTDIEVNNPPPLCDPPKGWSKVANQWVRE